MTKSCDVKSYESDRSHGRFTHLKWVISNLISFCCESQLVIREKKLLNAEIVNNSSRINRVFFFVSGKCLMKEEIKFSNPLNKRLESCMLANIFRMLKRNISHACDAPNIWRALKWRRKENYHAPDDLRHAGFCTWGTTIAALLAGFDDMILRPMWRYFVNDRCRKFCKIRTIKRPF